MDLVAFLPPLAVAARNSDQDLLERDVRLHLFLHELMAEPILREQLLFKGGTYLIKTILDYLRFSEDLDFTWFTQPTTGGKGKKSRRAAFDVLRRDVVKKVDAAAQHVGLARGPDGLKVDREGQLLTLRYSYSAAVGGAARVIKFEVSFQERILHPPVRVKARSLLAGPPSGPLRLADDATARAYTTPVDVRAYTIAEAHAEKARAFLTRGAVRGRDLLDLYELDRLGYPIEGIQKHAVAKVQYSIQHWDRFQVNPRWREQLDAVVRDTEAERLAIRQPPAQAVEAFAKRLRATMDRVVAELPK